MSPAVPSSRDPDSTMPIVAPLYAFAAVRIVGSIAGRCPFSRGAWLRRRCESSTTRWQSGGAT